MKVIDFVHDDYDGHQRSTAIVLCNVGFVGQVRPSGDAWELPVVGAGRIENFYFKDFEIANLRRRELIDDLEKL